MQVLSKFSEIFVSAPNLLSTLGHLVLSTMLPHTTLRKAALKMILKNSLCFLLGQPLDLSVLPFSSLHGHILSLPFLLAKIADASLYRSHHCYSFSHFRED